MLKRVLTALVCLGAEMSLSAAPKDATLVYNVAVREFECWREGELSAEARKDPCAPRHGWHPVTGNLHFVRGQAVSVLLVNGLVGDLFTLDVAEADLPEPTVAIAGEIKELPKLHPIPPLPSLIAGLGVTPTTISGQAELRNLLLRLLGTACPCPLS